MAQQNFLSPFRYAVIIGVAIAVYLKQHHDAKIEHERNR